MRVRSRPSSKKPGTVPPAPLVKQSSVQTAKMSAKLKEDEEVESSSSSAPPTDLPNLSVSHSVSQGAVNAVSKRMWLQGLHPKFVLALNCQPRETTPWMREQFHKQVSQLRSLEREGTVEQGTADRFQASRWNSGLEFKVDLESRDIIEWPLLGKRAGNFENPADPEWPNKNRVFYALNPHNEQLAAAERARVGEQSFRPADAAEKLAAHARMSERLRQQIKVSSIEAVTVPVETYEVLRPSAEVFGVVSKEHGCYYGEAKARRDPQTGQSTFVPPEQRRPEPSMPPNPKTAKVQVQFHT